MSYPGDELLSDSRLAEHKADEGGTRCDERDDVLADGLSPENVRLPAQANDEIPVALIGVDPARSEEVREPFSPVGTRRRTRTGPTSSRERTIQGGRDGSSWPESIHTEARRRAKKRIDWLADRGCQVNQ